MNIISLNLEVLALNGRSETEALFCVTAITSHKVHKIELQKLLREAVRNKTTPYIEDHRKLYSEQETKITLQ